MVATIGTIIITDPSTNATHSGETILGSAIPGKKHCINIRNVLPMFIFENIGRNINNVSIQCFTNVIWRRDDGNSLSWSLVARSRVADRYTPREKTLWNHFDKHMEKHNNYFLLMFLKEHWEKMVHVFTMFFSWDRRSQDGFPTVLSSYWRKVKLRFYHFYPDVSQMICIRRMIYCMSTSVFGCL